MRYIIFDYGILLNLGRCKCKYKFYCAWRGKLPDQLNRNNLNILEALNLIGDLTIMVNKVELLFLEIETIISTSHDLTE